MTSLVSSFEAIDTTRSAIPSVAMSSARSPFALWSDKPMTWIPAAACAITRWGFGSVESFDANA